MSFAADLLSSHPDLAEDIGQVGIAAGAAELDTEQVDVPDTFAEFVAQVNPTLLDFEHVPGLCSVVDRWLAREILNVMVLVPPRYFKTEVFSRLAPAYILLRHPSRMVGLASYGADLAWAISEEARGYYRQAGGSVRHDTAAKRRWRTAKGGEMWASGVGGPMLGFGYDYGIIDDPVDPEKVGSHAFQERFKRWYPAKFHSRGEPGAQKLVVMQRLGIDDPVEWLLKRETGRDGEDLAPDHWHIVALDEIRSEEDFGDGEGPRGLPATCTLEPDARKVGDVLAPSRMSPEQVAERQRVAGPLVVASQRQQRPSLPVGDFWRAEFFETYDELPEDAYNLGWDWDTAYTKQDVNAASAGIQTARGPGKRGSFTIYVEDVTWEWLEFPELVELIQTKAGPHFIEAKASGKSAEQSLKREGVAVRTVSVKGDKLARASHVQPVVNNQRIKVRESVLRRLLYGSRQGLANVTAELLARESGDLDLNDAFVQALIRHVGQDRRDFRMPFAPSMVEPAA